jgi:hypothetical protein
MLRWGFVVTEGVDKVDDKATAEQVACGFVAPHTRYSWGPESCR